MTQRIITPELLHEYQWVSDPAVHPDGKRAAYVHKRTDPENDRYLTHIRVACLDGSGDEAWTNGIQDSAPKWSPSGKALGFLRPEANVTTLYSVMQAGAEPVPLVRAKQRIGYWEWSPDGKRIAYATRIYLDEEQAELEAEQEKRAASRCGASYERNVPKAEGVGWWDGRYSHLFIADVKSGDTLQMTGGAMDVSQPKWSTDGGAIAYLSHTAKGDPQLPGAELHSGLYVQQVESGTQRRLAPGTYEIHQYAWSPDGEMIAFIGHENECGAGTQHALYVVSVSGHDLPRKLSAEDVQLGVYVLNDMTSGQSEAGPFFVPDPEGGFAIAAPVTRHGEVQLWLWRPDGSSQAVTCEHWVIHQAVLVPNSRQLVVQAITPSGPAELYLTNLDGGTVNQVTRWNDALKQSLAVSQPQPFWFKNDTGDPVQAWLMRPCSVAETEQTPLVLAIHGGPHAMYTAAYSHELQCLAAAGVSIVMANPRGSFGYGQSFAKAVLGNFGDGDDNDVLQALDEALTRFSDLDPLRIGVMGGSYGGLMTNWLIGRTKRFEAAVSQRGISNWLSFYGNSDIGSRYAEAMLGTHPWKDAARYWERSPISSVDRVSAPVLVMHGEQDLRCPVEQADQYYAMLKRWGKTARLVRYAGANHAFQKAGKPSLRIDVLNRVNDWFTHHLSAEKMRYVLGIPFALLLENCRSSGFGDGVIRQCIAEKDFSAVQAAGTADPEMDFQERAQLAEELGVDWDRVFADGYTFGFLHTNALKRLIYFRYRLIEGKDYVQDGDELRGVPLTATQAAELERLVYKQWKLERIAAEYRIARKHATDK